VKLRETIRLPVRVAFHLNEGYTRVLWDGFRADVPGWDIPTEIIPPHLRRLGSRFLLVWTPISVEVGDSADEIRTMMKFRVEEMLPP
jgi:hypothetical protein